MKQILTTDEQRSDVNDVIYKALYRFREDFDKYSCSGAIEFQAQIIALNSKLSGLKEFIADFINTNSASEAYRDALRMAVDEKGWEFDSIQKDDGEEEE